MDPLYAHVRFNAPPLRGLEAAQDRGVCASLDSLVEFSTVHLRPATQNKDRHLQPQRRKPLLKTQDKAVCVASLVALNPVVLVMRRECT